MLWLIRLGMYLEYDSRKDMVPKGKADPSYFSRKGSYEFIQGGGNGAYPFNPLRYRLGENILCGLSFPYRIWQAPGPTNSLVGRYKFNMPNSEAIYLHDTPNHNLLLKIWSNKFGLYSV